MAWFSFEIVDASADKYKFKESDWHSLKKSKTVESHKVGEAKPLVRPIPFWRKSEKVFERITEEREILVSAGVTSKEVRAETWHKMKMKAAGLVSVPLSFAAEQVWKFETLPKVSSSFEEVKFFPRQMKLYMHVSAIGFHARMIMQLEKRVNDGIHEIHWTNVEGSFKGMKGYVRLEKYSRGKTFFSTRSVYESKKLPLPKALVGIGMEVVAKAAASGMRDFLEKAYDTKL